MTTTQSALERFDELKKYLVALGAKEETAEAIKIQLATKLRAMREAVIGECEGCVRVRMDEFSKNWDEYGDWGAQMAQDVLAPVPTALNKLKQNEN